MAETSSNPTGLFDLISGQKALVPESVPGQVMGQNFVDSHDHALLLAAVKNFDVSKGDKYFFPAVHETEEGIIAYRGIIGPISQICQDFIPENNW